MNMIKYIMLSLGLLIGLTLTANKPPAKGKPSTGASNGNLELRVNCNRSNREIDLMINNVQCRLQVGGDIWWDRNNGRYIVPKVPVGSELPEVSSIFAGGVWIGGIDPGGNLKVAASAYGNGGVDYFAGPLDFETGLTDDVICQQWDQFFTVTGADVLKSIRGWEQALADGREFKIDSVPDAVRYWPGQGNIYFEDEYGFKLPETDAGLGNFWDQDDDKIYSPEKGDFPVIDIRGCEPASRKVAQELVPDEMIYWIYNDAGNTHEESGAAQIRMEVQVQAFAYATNNEINDMTFYRFKLINRAREDIRETYFAMWVDPDLGCFTDDYSGCDVGRSLAYTYNADEIDGTSGENCDTGIPTYGSNVPLIGTDYFRGPLAPKVLTTADDGMEHVVVRSDSWSPFDSIIGPDGMNKGIEPGDTVYIRDPNIASGESSNFNFELGMSSCIIYFNGGQGQPPPGQVDPQAPEDYYNYMRATWPSGEPMTFGGTGLNPGSTDFVNYSFSSPPNESGGWSMWEEGIQGLDTRTVQASGPFLLKPNAVNELIVGAVWVPDVDHPAPSLIKLTTADDIAQNLFDNCFDIIDGPDAPTVCPIALDQEIILVLNNDLIESNNANEAYSEVDILSSMDIPEEDRTYVFEGYKIFQLVNSQVSTQDLDDISKARLVAQVDQANGVSEMYNWTSSTDPNASITGNTEFIWTPELVVSGADLGIENTFRITRDQFSADDPVLINHKKYYYLAIAYAYNEYEKFNPNNPTLTQARPYLEGRRNIRTYEVIPRPIVYRDLNAAYGDGAIITRLEGVGTGGAFLDITEEDRTRMLNRYQDSLAGNQVSVADFDGRIVYKEGAGPMEVKIYNPLEVRDGRFELRILGDHTGGSTCAIDEGARWEITNLDNGDVYTSDRSIDEINEQLIVEYGFSVKISQQSFAGSNEKDNNGAVAAIEEFVVPDAEPWYRGVTDELSDVPAEVTGFASNLFDFIKNDGPEPDGNAFRADPDQNFNMLGNGYWYPFQLTSSVNQTGGGFNIPYITPGWLEDGDGQSEVRGRSLLRDLNNVDIVLTSDKSNWSRCMVLESRNRDYGFQDMMDLKEQASVDKNGLASGSAEANFINATGMSWFPGYVIDVETGKRLNIFFSENSSFDENFASDQGDPSLGNGNDMLFNPTDREILTPTYADLLQDLQANMDLRNIFLGGQHMIYVTRQEYDGCKQLRDRYSGGLLAKSNMLKSVTWTSIAMMQPGEQILSYEEGVVPTDMIFKLRVDRPYNLETTFDLDFVNSGCFTVNDSFPVYEFEILGKTPLTQDATAAESALDAINAVPNPYYAYSAYETSQVDNTVKITNLPARSIITIYSLDGKFIKQFNRDEQVFERGGANPGVINSQVLPDVEWDLQNSAGIPIASGVYLIHVSVPGVGERTIKWFGVNRKFDPAGL